MASVIMPGINKVLALEIVLNTDALNNLFAIKPWTVTSCSVAKEIYAMKVSEKRNNYIISRLYFVVVCIPFYLHL